MNLVFLLLRGGPSILLSLGAVGLFGPMEAVQKPQLATASDIVELTAPPPDAQISYGKDPLQFGHLRLPSSQGPHPLVILIHGGCFLAQYDLEHTGPASEALTELGFAVWSLEYRRVGNPGGGWPGTFLDIARGTDFVRGLAAEYSLDVNQVITMGHSAGGHLALWAAARHRLPPSSPLYLPNPLIPKGVVALGSVPTLEMLHKEQACGAVVNKLMGGSPLAVPERYSHAAPAHLFPLGVPQILINGRFDESWFRFGKAYFDQAQQAGEDIRFIVAPESGHFEVIMPASSTWPIVTGALESILGKP